MANLGGFAGGLAEGINTGRKMNLAQQELEDSRNFRERQMKIAEEDQSYQRIDRERQDSANTALSELYKNHYGGDVKPGMDASHDSRFYVDSTALSMIKTGKFNPELLAKAAQHVNEVKQTEEGKVFFGAMAGDPAAKTALATKSGLDPAGLKFVRDGGGRAMFTDGKKSVDVSAQMGWLIGARGFEMAEQLNKSNQAGMQLQGNLQLKDAQVQAAKASATKDVAYAGYLDSGGKAGADGSSKASAKIATFLSADPMFKNDFGARARAQSLAEHIAATKGISPESAGGEGGMIYRDLINQARQLKKAGQFPDKTAEQVAEMGIQKIIQSKK